MSAREKLEKLNKIYLEGSGANEEELNKIIEWSKGLSKLENWESFLSDPITKNIIEKMKGMIKTIDDNLLSNSDLYNDKGKIIFERKKSLMWLLSVLDIDYTGEEKLIERELDKALGN